jgi:lipopolysaccharide transport system permease protein
MSFAVGLFMYVTPVIYPTSIFLNKLPSEKHWLIYANPLTSVFDVFHKAFLGVGHINIYALGYSCGFAIIVYIMGLYVFNRVERTFMDTI